MHPEFHSTVYLNQTAQTYQYTNSNATECVQSMDLPAATAVTITFAPSIKPPRLQHMNFGLEHKVKPVDGMTLVSRDARISGGVWQRVVATALSICSHSCSRKIYAYFRANKTRSLSTSGLFQPARSSPTSAGRFFLPSTIRQLLRRSSCRPRARRRASVPPLTLPQQDPSNQPSEPARRNIRCRSDETQPFLPR